MMLHVPVMLQEVLEALRPWEEQVCVVDGTLGAAGHARAILENCPRCRLVGIDQDPSALDEARLNLAPYGDRVTLIPGNFRDLSTLLPRYDIKVCSAFLFDLGVSSMQIDREERGFSFHGEGPLDMRMDSGTLSRGVTAADIVNSWELGDLIGLFRRYGEDPFAVPIARAIVMHRERYGPLMTTESLVALIRRTLPAPAQRKAGTHPARRIFQALRIAVNDEMEALRETLESLPSFCGDPATVVFITYHSLEDRLVKQHMKTWAAEGKGLLVTKKPLVPREEEIRENKRSRSAKLRVFRFGPVPTREERRAARRKEGRSGGLPSA